MNAILFTLLIPQLGGSAGEPATQGHDAAQRADVTRSYDVRALGLHTWRDRAVDGHGLALLPAVEIESNGGGHGDSGVEFRGLADERYVNLLVDLLGSATQFPGRGIAVTPSGRLVVTGPEELHAQAAGLTELLMGAAAGELQVAVDVVPMTASTALPGDPVRVPRARALELAQGSSERFVLPLRSDGTASVDQTRSVPIILDFDVEVASGASVQSPRGVDAALGTQILVHGAPAPGGALLSFAIKCGDVRLAQRATPIAISSRHVGDDGHARDIVMASHVEDPRWSSFSVATSCFLGADEALVLRGSGPGGAPLLLVVHLLGSANEPIRNARFTGGGSVAMVHLGSLAPPEIWTFGVLTEDGFRQSSRLHAYELTDPDSALLRALPTSPPATVQRDTLVRALGRGIETWEVGPWFVVRAPDRDVDLAAAAGDMAADARGRDLQVDVRLEPATAPKAAGGDEFFIGKNEGKPRCAASFPLRLGTTAAVVAGDETLDVLDYDVEIAERSACTDLNPCHVFDGLACTIRPMPLPDGRILLEVEGTAQIQGERRAKVTSDTLVNQLDERDSWRLDLRSRTVVTAGEDGVYRATIGSRTASSPRVVIELR